MSQQQDLELMALVQIREILEPVPGRLMQDELVELVRQTKAKADRVSDIETSTEWIGRSKERFKELAHKKFDWRSFYNGWLEGRAEFLKGRKG